jgi:hypothetical protein
MPSAWATLFTALRPIPAMAREAAPAREPFRKSLLLSSDMIYSPLLEKFCVCCIIAVLTM